MDKERTLISREPWWAHPPGPGQSERDVEWGYLEVWSDGSVRFVRERPSDEEIKNRKSCRVVLTAGPDPERGAG